MKTSVAVVLAMILGAAAGGLTAGLRIWIAPWDGDPGGQRPGTRVAARPGEPMPKVVVDQEEYKFGTMDVDAEGSHDFIFTNAGERTLELTAGETSCNCTVSEVEEGKIPPGESAKVTVKWTAERRELGAYRQTTTIRANDPGRPRVELVISGRITVTVRAVPNELLLGRLTAGEPLTEEVSVYCYLDEPLEISGCELTNQETAEHFEVTDGPLPSDLLKQEEEARSGRLITVTVKPGLPLGAFRQRILIRTNLESVPKVEIPIAGSIVGDISIVGPGWDGETGVLTLGMVSSREGLQRALLLVTRGPHCKEVEFKTVRTDPDLLEVKLGERTEIGNGRVTQTPLIIQIPKGSRPANHLGSKQGPLGEILIKASHSQTPQLRIRVRFAVEG